MFGRHFKGLEHTAYLGWRAIFHPSARNPVDILPDRGSRIGDDKTIDEIVKWLDKKNPLLGNQTPWKWMVQQSKQLSTSDGSYIQFADGEFILEAGPQRSYGYLYIGAAKVSDWQDFKAEPEPGIVEYDSQGRRVDKPRSVAEVKA